MTFGFDKATGRYSRRVLSRRSGVVTRPASLLGTSRKCCTMCSSLLAYNLLIIGYGNGLRRDDGAGLVLAEKLAVKLSTRGVAVHQLAVQQLVPELALTIANADLDGVLFVDTVADRGVTKIIFHSLVDAAIHVALGHHLTPQALLLYAARLYGHCPPAWLVAIPGTDFGHGEGFSPQTTQLLADVAPLATTVLDAIRSHTFPVVTDHHRLAAIHLDR